MKRTLFCMMAALLWLALSGTVLASTVHKALPPPGDFSTVIDNPYWPLPLGQSFRYVAETEDGCEYNKVSIIRDTDMVMGYYVLTVRDQEWVHEPEDDEECSLAEAELEEDTLDYYGQDIEGNVWYFGEDTLSYDDDGFCTDEGAWLAGEDGAIPGIIMLTNPQAGLRYQQEYKEDEAEDWAAVLRLNANVSIEAGDFSGCLVTKEWTPLEPGSVEHKYYCPDATSPGPGLVFINELQGKNVFVIYLGTGSFGIPGEFDAFPALNCPPL